MGFEWTGSRAKFLIDGNVVETRRLSFEPKIISLFVSSAKVLAEKIETE